MRGGETFFGASVPQDDHAGSGSGYDEGPQCRLDSPISDALTHEIDPNINTRVALQVTHYDYMSTSQMATYIPSNPVSTHTG